MKRQTLHFNAWSLAERHQQNLRKHRRFPTYQKAWIVCNGEKSCYCTVVDMSARGAQIKLSGKENVPEEFDLLIIGETYLKSIPVTMKWRKGTRIGVSFRSGGVIF